MNPPSTPPPPVALTIAGSDSSAGAGIQADLKTFAAHGVYGVNAVAGVVAESPDVVSRVVAMNSTLLTHQLERVEAAFPLAAVKTGMLGTGKNVAAVADFLLSRPDLPCVVDPIIRADAGTPLSSGSGVQTVRDRLLPLAALVTPNLPEAIVLLGRELDSAEAIADGAREIHERYGCDVLVKGGHVADDHEAIDCAWIRGEAKEFRRPRLDVPDLHGTGCTLSAAIAARLARGEPLPDAIAGAAAYLAEAMARHFRWPDPAGTVALNHFPNGVDSPRP